MGCPASEGLWGVGSGREYLTLAFIPLLSQPSSIPDRARMPPKASLSITPTGHTLR